MGKKKFHNQVVNTITQRMECLACGEHSELLEPPVLLETYVKHMKTFVRLHDAKGCNKNKIEPNGKQ